MAMNFKVFEDKQKSVLIVKDFGIGIKEEDQQHIFERFYRVDKARSRDSGGTVLGLSIAKHIVEAHKGRISVSSKPNEGSTFKVIFWWYFITKFLQFIVIVGTFLLIKFSVKSTV